VDFLRAKHVIVNSISEAKTRRWEKIISKKESPEKGLS